MSEYELALQEYMAKLKGGFAQSMDNVNNNVTGVMDGVGARGLNSKAESGFLKTLMGGGTGGAGAVDELAHANITNTDIGNTPAEREALLAGFAPDVSNLGIGSRGLDTPAESQFLENSFAGNQVAMPGRTPTIPNLVPTGQPNYAGTGQPNMDAPVIDRQKFNTQFAALTEQEKRNVEEIMANMNDLEKANFAAGLTGMPLSGFVVQDEMLDYTRGY
tara:strand:- start:93 stop:746 length:654 start_codon:yes stop_codon:yes gene_type:complete